MVAFCGSCHFVEGSMTLCAAHGDKVCKRLMLSSWRCLKTWKIIWQRLKTVVCTCLSVSLYLVWIRFLGEMPFPQGHCHEAAEALAPLWNPAGPSPHSCAAPCKRSHPLSCWSLLFKTQQKTFTFQVCLEGETCWEDFKAGGLSHVILD